MARVFVTGSSDGLGLMAAQLMVRAGHRVLLHGRNAQRAEAALAAVPGAEGAVAGDLAAIAATRALAEQVNSRGAFDAIIHNAGIGYQERSRDNTADRLPPVFAVNSLAPYLLTALIAAPKRLIYISSGMHHGADAMLDDLTWNQRRWNGAQAYAESKLYNVVLAFAVARRWPNVLANALEPGWVATKMGGRGAPDSLRDGAETQVWLATSEEPAARVSGAYFRHKKRLAPNPRAQQRNVQERFLTECERLSGIAFPQGPRQSASA